MSSLENKQVAACVDIGGTKTLIAFIDPEGNVLARDRYLVGSEREPKELVRVLSNRLQDLAHRSGILWEQVAGLGYSTAGMIDVESGVIFASPNQGAWRDVPFRKMLRECLGLPVWIEMDANAAALGEAWKGIGAGTDHFVFIVIGTGIGAGILVHGEILRGWRGTAGEIGHTTIEADGPLCNCGNYGCLEALAAGPAIALRAQAALQQGRPSILPQLAGDGPVTAETVFQAVRQGDLVAEDVLTKVVDYLGIGLANVITLLNPQVIALGGGVALGGGDLFMEPLRKAVARRCGSWVDLEGTRIVLSELGENAGLLGAARLVWKEREKRKMDL